jgi:ABC-type uncharacterized transport system substrate-binding protein
MSHKIVVLTLSAVLFMLCLPVQAQQPTKVPRIGYLSLTGSAISIAAFRQGLRALGYIEGKNILIEYRNAGGKSERYPSLVTELLQLKVDAILVSALSAIRAAKQATKTIPIVMITTTDPVAAGLIESLARPGGNITGLTLLARELSGKRMELLKEVIPTVSRVGFLSRADSPAMGIRFKEYETAARALKIQLQYLEVQSQNPNFEAAFRDAVRGQVSAFITVRSGLFNDYRKEIADLAIKNRLASACELSSYVEAGGLMSYAPDTNAMYQRAAVYMDKILKGANPGELPVEQPRKFELVFNLRTAKEIGLTIPPNVLARADKVIK